MADLLFISFGFSCFGYAELASYLLFWLNPNQSNSWLAIGTVIPHVVSVH